MNINDKIALEIGRALIRAIIAETRLQEIALQQEQMAVSEENAEEVKE